MDLGSGNPVQGATGVRAPTASAAERYRPIAQYGVIGDCRTAALVGPDGSIDWLCLPHFDSEAILLRLLDANRGGYFRVQPRATASTQMEYLPGTNVLETRFATPEGRLRLVDFMPVRPRARTRQATNPVATLLPGIARSSELEREAGNDVAAAHHINRLVTCLGGTVELQVALKATFNYAREDTEYTPQLAGPDAVAALVSAPGRALVFLLRLLPSNAASANPPKISLDIREGVLSTSVTLQAGERVVALLQYARSLDEARTLLDTLLHHDFDADLDETLGYWHDWSARSHYTGLYQQAVLRSALALKLCTFEPTGAIVAAPTTSLPEWIGGVRNWDYRYTWLRDSAFTLAALANLGYHEEARNYFHFLHDLHICGAAMTCASCTAFAANPTATWRSKRSIIWRAIKARGPCALATARRSSASLTSTANCWTPATAICATRAFVCPRSSRRNRDLWSFCSMVADYVIGHWQELDRGIWEVRGDPQAFVYSRVMCWVALDRACKLARHYRHHNHANRWETCRDAIQQDILEHGYSEQLRSFTQAYGNDALDAANLRLLLVEFLSPTDPRIRSTIDVATAHAGGRAWRRLSLSSRRAAPLPMARQELPMMACPAKKARSWPAPSGWSIICAIWAALRRPASASRAAALGQPPGPLFRRSGPRQRRACWATIPRRSHTSAW